MNRLKKFITTTIFGGMLVALPIAIFLFVLKWAFNLITDLIQPLTNVIINQWGLPEILGDVIVVTFIIISCFFLGFFIRTRLGKWIFDSFEESLFKKAPGYTMIKETIVQFIGNNESPFSSVVLAQIFQNETLVTAFVTDRHGNGTCSVFVPTGPNPTSGFIYHLEEKYVHKIDVPVEVAMRSVISCGAGSSKLMKVYRDRIKA